MREVVEEFQAPQLRVTLLAIHTVFLCPQALVDARQFRRKLLARLEATVGVLQHGGSHHRFHILRHFAAQGMDRRCGGIHNLVQQARQGGGTERSVPGQQFVHHGAKRIQIAARSHLQPLYLLWRHVTGAAGNAIDARHLRPRHDGDAEVDDAHLVVRGEHDVGRLDVAMDNATAVRIVQSTRALEGQFHHIVRTQ